MQNLTESRVLTTSDVITLSTIVEAAVSCKKVKRGVDEGGDVRVISGVARSIGSATGMFDHNSDVRDQYLRVTDSLGAENFWLVSDLIDDIRKGLFFVTESGR